MSGFVSDVADVGCGYAVNLSGESFQIARMDCEEQLEVFTSIQSELKWIKRQSLVKMDQGRIDRNPNRLNSGPDPAFTTEMEKVGRQSVADVDHGRRQARLVQRKAPGHSRLRTKLPEQ